jgi:serine/threonine protein kinase
MELVTGVSITEYCDKNNLSTKERLNLFIQVCSAVQHAHQKGIIHRDIKPTNVMVEHHDGKPVPKVIDFGIAKATNQRLTEKTLFTRYAHIIGTPAYMSPEQAELSALGIDIRSDIYSLGVLLYELLTGTTPFSDEELRKAGYLEMQRIIREQEPAKPSTKLSTLGETLGDIAKRRGCTPDLLAKTIRGDLDWIAMKALEKNRVRRYDEASDFALDIERHLEHRPVSAHAPSASYRARKFLRRHRSQTIAAAAIVVLAGALIVVLSMLNQSWREVIKSEALRADADYLGHEKTLSIARKYLNTNHDLISAVTTVKSILSSEHVGAEARLLYARIYLDLGAGHYKHVDEKPDFVANMRRYFDILDSLGAEGQDNQRLKDVLIGLSRGTAENLGPVVNSSFAEAEPCISPDGLKLFFNGDRPGGSGNWDMWVTTRETMEHEWGSPKNLGEIVNSAGQDLGAHTSSDGLELYLSSTRAGGSGDYDVWIATRAKRGDPWGVPTNLGAPINTRFLDAGGLAPDGLELYIVSDRPGGYGNSDIWVSRRPTTDDEWGEPVNLGETVNTSWNESYPCVTADGLMLFFSDGLGNPRPGGFGDLDIWVTTRRTKEDDWGEPVNLGPVVNTPNMDRAGGISADGSVLYFCSNRLGGYGTLDVYKVSISTISESFEKNGAADAAKGTKKSDDGKGVMSSNER